MRILLFLFWLLLAQYAHAQKSIYKWQDESCEYKGKFDSTKVTRKQLEGAHTLIQGDEFLLNYVSVFQIGDINRLNLAVLDSDYIAKREKLLSLPIPGTNAWENFRKE